VWTNDGKARFIIASPPPWNTQNFLYLDRETNPGEEKHKRRASPPSISLEGGRVFHNSEVSIGYRIMKLSRPNLLNLPPILASLGCLLLATCEKPSEPKEEPTPAPRPVPVEVPKETPVKPEPTTAETRPSRYRPGGPKAPTREAEEQPATTEAPASKEFHTVGVFYGTNRKPTGFREPNAFYGAERHREGPMSYGRIDVSIPLHHTIGVVERPKWYKLEFSEDPKKHVMLLKLETLDKGVFFSEIKTRATAQDAGNEALIFIHGYNVAFPDAIQRTAQIAFDLDFHGVPIAFSWPSQAALEGYTIDQDNATWSVPHLSQFLIDLQETTDLESIHIIAHSMGTRILTQALAKAHDDGFRLKLNNIILAAPDIDADVFKEQILPKMQGIAKKTTMYSSSSDTALKVSQKIHGNDRLGLGGENLRLLDGMDTINATNIDTSLLGHGYYGSHKVVVRDILNLVIRHLDPPQRDLVKGPLGAWEFEKAPEETPPSTKE
jgi:esterase/lipase superfamily enzyme